MEQMRSEFEAWFADAALGMYDEYKGAVKIILFHAWAASRAAIEIEPPETESYVGTRQVTFERDAMWLDAIRAAGLRVKEK